MDKPDVLKQLDEEGVTYDTAYPVDWARRVRSLTGLCPVVSCGCTTRGQGYSAGHSQSPCMAGGCCRWQGKYRNQS